MDAYSLRQVVEGAATQLAAALGGPLLKIAREWERSNDLEQAKLTANQASQYRYIREGQQQR